MKDMPITTQDNFAEYKIVSTLGLVRGNTVRSRNVLRNMVASLRTIIGGEIIEYTEAVTQSRDQALNRMVVHAEEMGADAIVGVRFVSADVDQGCTEILVYGTAVKLEK